jgi:hypothetical protein
MISRIITRGILPTIRLCASTPFTLATPKFSFGKVQKAGKFHSVIDEEIKTESENLNDLEAYEKEFKNGGWTVSKESTLIELSRTSGAYQVRLLSNVKTPTQFDDENNNNNNEDGQQNNDENEYQGEMNEITICVTKTGSEKTMIINTIVTEGFEISNINFAKDYEAAKASRLDIFGTNNYTGPEIETLSEELFESLYTFIEEELGITNETMESFADYSLDGEQSFYIEWLKDLKSIV